MQEGPNKMLSFLDLIANAVQISSESDHSHLQFCTNCITSEAEATCEAHLTKEMNMILLLSESFEDMNSTI
jgi:hypothetical protein